MTMSPASIEPGTTCDREVFREVISHFMTGVTIVTAYDGERDHGMSVSSVASLSLDPPMVVVCLNSSSPTQRIVASVKRFCVNVLAENQHELALRFASPAPDKFAGISVRRGVLRTPILPDALAALECLVERQVAGGSHQVFLARVIRAEARDAAPLAYFRGEFGRVELAAKAGARTLVRSLVLNRELPVGQPLAIPELAKRLDLSRSHTFQAMLALEAEGLVERTEDGGFSVVPVTQEIVEQAFDARMAIELAVVDLTHGRADTSRVAELRRRADVANGFVHGGRFSDVEAYTRSNTELHEQLVALADNAPLLAAYRQLSVPTLMVRLFTRNTLAHPSLVDEHLELVAAYASGDADRARHAVTVHSQHAKQVNQAALANFGGEM